MDIFNPFISSCEHERDLSWVLKLVKGLPQKKEVDSALEEVRNVEKRAAGMVEKVENIIKNATAAAKDEIRRELSESIGRVESAERNTLAKAQDVENVVDNAINIASEKISQFVNSQLEEIRLLAEQISEDSGYVAQVVEDAGTAIKNQIIEDINTTFNAFSSELENRMAESFNELRDNQNQQFSDALMRSETLLSTRIDDKIGEAQAQLNNALNQQFGNAVDGVHELARQYIPNAVAQSVNERFATCGVFIPVNAWNNKTARVNANMNLDVTSLFVTYSPSSFDSWYDNGVRCVGVEGSYLIFQCETTPSSELYVYVVAVENIVYGGDSV